MLKKIINVVLTTASVGAAICAAPFIALVAVYTCVIMVDDSCERERRFAKERKIDNLLQERLTKLKYNSDDINDLVRYNRHNEYSHMRNELSFIDEYYKTRAKSDEEIKRDSEFIEGKLKLGYYANDAATLLKIKYYAKEYYENNRPPTGNPQITFF
jgi:hypothetical protein